MRRTRHTRKRHTRRKHKRKRTRHRRRTGGGSGQSPLPGGYKESFVNPLGGGGKKAIIFSDFPPGFRDKAARAAFRKMERKSRKHKRKHKSRKRKRRRRKH